MGKQGFEPGLCVAKSEHRPPNPNERQLPGDGGSQVNSRWGSSWEQIPRSLAGGSKAGGVVLPRSEFLAVLFKPPPTLPFSGMRENLLPHHSLSQRQRQLLFQEDQENREVSWPCWDLLCR